MALASPSPANPLGQFHQLPSSPEMASGITAERSLTEEDSYQRPQNDDVIDCEKLSSYLQQVYPQCRDQSSGSSDDSNERPNDFLLHHSLVPLSFELAVKKRLTLGELRFLRLIIDKSVSSTLNERTPFRVPKPTNSKRKRRYLRTNRDIIVDSSFLEDIQEDYFDLIHRGLGGGGSGSGAEEESENIGNNGARKSNIWLHHWYTGLSGSIATSVADDYWYYPMQVEYMAWWKDSEQLVTDPDLLMNITKVCWQVGNYTIQNGELKKEMKKEVDKQLQDEAGLDANDFEEEDTRFTWLLDEEDAFVLNGQPGKALSEGSSSGAVVIPTYPIPLYKAWERREYLGSLIFFAVISMATLLRCCVTRSDRSEMPQKILVGAHLLTEEGVNDILQVGWKYQKPKDGSTSQLFLQVYDKSKLGYNDDSSMLMGGVEKAAIATNKALTNATAPTERDTNPTHRGSASDSSNSRLPLSTTNHSNSSAPGGRSEDEGGRST